MVIKRIIKILFILSFIIFFQKINIAQKRITYVGYNTNIENNQILNQKYETQETQQKILIYLAILVIILIIGLIIIRKYQKKRNTDSNSQLSNTLLKNHEKEIEATQLQLAQTQLQLIQAEKMASLGILTAGVAHEINNPVNIITSSTYGLHDYIEELKKILNTCLKLNEDKNKIGHEEFENLKKELDLNLNKTQSLINYINEGAERISGIVSSLKMFTRINHEKTTIDINKNIENTLLILNKDLKDRITVEKNFDKDVIVNCYSDKINQVLLNMLLNASQSIEQKGTITISTKKINASKEVLISIKDTGCGIPKNIQSNIFDPFFTTKKLGEGTGLGLYICYNIVMQHNGHINVESKKNKGTEFKIILPQN